MLKYDKYYKNIEQRLSGVRHGQGRVANKHDGQLARHHLYSYLIKE